MQTEILISPFETRHLPGALRLSQAVSWPHRLADWNMMHKISKGAVALRNGEVIGTALATRFGPDITTANMVLVSAGHRGAGLGCKLMERILPVSGTCRLVATQDGLPLYQKMGFVETAHIHQMQGILQNVPDATMPVREAEPDDLKRIEAMETKAFGDDRSVIIHWLRTHGRLFVAPGSGARPTGYCATRAFGRGHVIGPVVAGDAETAMSLISMAGRGLLGQFVRIDTEKLAGLQPWLETLGLTMTGGGTAMQKGPAPVPAPRFAMFSQAWG